MLFVKGCPNFCIQLYGAGLETWHYGQAVAAEEEDGQADDTQGKKKVLFLFCFLQNPPPQNKQNILLPWVVG